MLLFSLFSVNNRNNYSGFFTVVFSSLGLQNNEYAPRLNCALHKLLSFGAIQKSLNSISRTLLWIIQMTMNSHNNSTNNSSKSNNNESNILSAVKHVEQPLF